MSLIEGARVCACTHVVLWSGLSICEMKNNELSGCKSPKVNVCTIRSMHLNYDCMHRWWDARRNIGRLCTAMRNLTRQVNMLPFDAHMLGAVSATVTEAACSGIFCDRFQLTYTH